ncbi:ABC transporter substrate-binding protein [Microbacterium sp. 18062]|uniref:substrate-binding periplasmic protein n=1 Tax=Microbacterium sp. 18062 TaxID=2681410 RepID=UPI00135BBC21|nr:transporter substrate-binding domain-containing protein [Microbacterium sp. 18062]
MKSTRTLIAALALTAACGVALAGCSASPDDTASTDGTESKGTLVFSATGAAAPYSYLDDDGVMDGYDVELCTTIAESLGYDVEFESVDFQATIAGVTAGRFDGVCTGTTATEERMNSTDFMLTDVTSTDGLTALVRADDTAHQTLESLDGARWGKTAGGVESDNLAAYLGITVDATEYPGFAQAIIDLKNDRIDAIPNSAGVAGYFATDDSELAVITPAVAEFNNAIILKNDEELRTAFNEKIAEMRADGSLDALQEKWFGVATAPVEGDSSH